MQTQKSPDAPINGADQTKVSAPSGAVVQTIQASPSERFTASVLANYAKANGAPAVTDFQKRLIQSYFIKIDQVLKAAETKRMQKSEQQRDPLAFDWKNIDLNKLAVDVVAFSSVGLDPLQKNHLHPIPYKNNSKNQYDITFIKGFNGIELVAKKYGYEVPEDVVIRIVYANEKFKPIYKDANNSNETYIHEPSENPFEKGDVVGGYYYHVFHKEPQKNKLRVFSIAEIEKRIPKTASVEFWGGEKDKWNGNKKDGKEKVEGWRDEMVWKTLKRAAWDAINIDSQKIDDNVQKILSQQEIEVKEEFESNIDDEIKNNANKKKVDFSHAEEAVIVTESADEIPKASPEPVQHQQTPTVDSSFQPQPDLFKTPQSDDGPGF